MKTKTIDELQDIIQNLREALIKIQATVWTYKNSVHTSPDSVVEQLAEMEVEIEKVLENNKTW